MIVIDMFSCVLCCNLNILRTVFFFVTGIWQWRKNDISKIHTTDRWLFVKVSFNELTRIHCTSKLTVPFLIIPFIVNSNTHLILLKKSLTTTINLKYTLKQAIMKSYLFYGLLWYIRWFYQISQGIQSLIKSFYKVSVMRMWWPRVYFCDQPRTWNKYKHSVIEDVPFVSI